MARKWEGQLLFRKKRQAKAPRDRYRRRDRYAVRAAEDGYVIFSDKGPGGYGLMVILRHPNGFHTIYAHNSENVVKKGAKVRQER